MGQRRLFEAAGDDGAAEGGLEAVGHRGVAERVGLVEHDACGAESQRLHLGIEHLGDALWGGSVGGLAAAALAEELRAVDNLGDGLAQPEAPTTQTTFAVAAGITGSQAACALSGSRLLPSASANT